MDLNDSSSTDIIRSIKTLNKYWKINDEFLTWEYGKYHLKQSDNDRLHCCTFALGGKWEHSHQENSRIKCLTCFYFFHNKVFPFLNNVNDEVSSNHKDEVESRMAAAPKLSNDSTHYASHCLRANVQFAAIEKLCSQRKQIHPSFIWFHTTRRRFFRWFIVRERLITF